MKFDRFPNNRLIAWWDAAKLGTLTGPVFGVTPLNGDLTSAWQLTNCTKDVSGADKFITDTNDGGPTEHYIGYVLPTSYVVDAGAITTFTIDLKPGTKTWARIQLGNANVVWVNLTTGANGTVGPGMTCVSKDLGSGWRRYILTGPIGGSRHAYIVICNANGSITYQGDGTGTIYVGAWEVEQQRVHLWRPRISRAPGSWILEQSAIGRRPRWVSGQVTRPEGGVLGAIYADEVRTDRLFTLGELTPQPYTVCVQYKFAGTAGANPTYDLHDSYPTGQNRRHTRISGTGYIFTDAGAAGGVTSNAWNGTWQFNGEVYNGASSSHTVDGTKTTGNVGANSSSGLSLFAFGNTEGQNPFTGWVRHLFLFEGAMSDADIASIRTNLVYMPS